MSDFKNGDKVYYPTATNAIVKLEKSDSVTEYPLLGTWASLGNTKKCVTRFLSDGRVSFSHQYSSIFPATQEWYEKLVVIYPNLEAPPKRKKPREIIQALLDAGWNIVPVIYKESEHKCLGYANRTYATMTAIPIDPKSGKVIIDYVNGEVVLED